MGVKPHVFPKRFVVVVSIRLRGKNKVGKLSTVETVLFVICCLCLLLLL